MSTAQPIDEQPSFRTEPPVAAAADSRVFGILSLVLGAVSIVAGNVFVPIAAIVVGILGLKREPATRTLSIWGIVLGSATIVLPVLAVMLGLALLAPLGLAAAFNGF